MNKKGFTLIELLAVIVILAIILVVAVPQILGVVKDSKTKSTEYSAKGIDSSVRNFYFEELLDQNSRPDETIFECDGTGCKSSGGDVLAFSGQVPNEGKILLDNDGKVYYLEDLIFDDYKCFSTSDKNFTCVDKNDESEYKAIYYIEDLIDFGLDVNGGKDYSGGKVILARNLSFSSDSSYLNPNSTTYGDINKNGTVEGLKTELTTGKGMSSIGKTIISERAQILLNMSFQALVDMLPSVNAISNICAYYGCTDLNQFASWFDPADPYFLAREIIRTYIRGGYYTDEDYHYHYFSGTLDGYNHNIDNIYINKPTEEPIGLFFMIKDATIQNINMSGTVSGKSFVGLLAGSCDRCVLQNINVTSTINSATSDVGGIVGNIYSSTVYNVNATSNVTAAGDWAGGITGFISNSTMDKCSSTSTITSSGGSAIGGLVGTSNGADISNSSSNSSVAGTGWVGGLIGTLANATLRNSHASGSVQISGCCGNAGGLIGSLVGIAKNSYSTTNISGTGGHIGGLIGMIGSTNFNHSIIGVSNCYSTGNVSATSELGGLVGQNGASSENSKTKYILIKNSFSLGNVTGTGGTVGGLVGTNVMNVENVFAKGNASGSTVGNIIGNQENSTYTITNAYSISTQTLTGTPVLIKGSTVTPSSLNTASWWQNTLHLGSSFKYEDGYYPLLYKVDEAGNVINELVEGQTKIPTN